MTYRLFYNSNLTKRINSINDFNVVNKLVKKDLINNLQDIFFKLHNKYKFNFDLNLFNKKLESLKCTNEKLNFIEKESKKYNLQDYYDFWPLAKKKYELY